MFYKRKDLMHKLKAFFQSKPVFVFLLPAFFILHRFTENFDFISVKAAFFLFALYIGISLILVFLSWLFFRDLYKAALTAFFITCLQFFFGSIHDHLKKVFPHAYITKYSILIPAVFHPFYFFYYYTEKKKEITF